MSARKRNMDSGNENDGGIDPGQDTPASRAPTATPANAATKPVSHWKSSAPKHAAAAMLHKWAQYAHNNGKEMELTREDYDSAIEAASKRIEGKYKPHAPALYQKKVK